MNGHQRRHAHTFGEQLAHAMPGRLGRDHRHIDIGGRLDLSEMNVEAVGEHQRLALGHMGRDFGLIQSRPGYDPGPGSSTHRPALAASATFITFSPAASALATLLLAAGSPTTTSTPVSRKIQRVRVPLAAVADDGHRFALERCQISVFFVISFCHLVSRLPPFRSNFSFGADLGTGGARRSFLASSDIATVPERVTSISP